MARRRIPEPLIGFVLAVVVVGVLYYLARTFHWFGDDPTFSGAAGLRFIAV